LFLYWNISAYTLLCHYSCGFFIAHRSMPQSISGQIMRKDLSSQKPRTTAREQWYDLKKASKLINAGMGRNTLFAYLRNEGFLLSDNEPYQAFIDEGIFKMVLKDIRGKNRQLLFRQSVTLVSEKGIRLLTRYIEQNLPE